MDNLTRPAAPAVGLDDGIGRRLFVALVASLPNSREEVAEGRERPVAAATPGAPALGSADVRVAVDVGLNVVGLLVGGRDVVEGRAEDGATRGAVPSRALPTVPDGNALGLGLAVALAGADILDGETAVGRSCGNVDSLAEGVFKVETVPRTVVCSVG